MGKIKEDELLRILVEQGFISREQAIDCSAVAKQTRELGLKQTVLDVAVQKGYLTKDRRVEAVRFIKSRGQDRARVSIPGYEIREKIGEGGMGTVYRGVQVTLDRPVAIKVLPRRLSSDQVFVQRFLREARSAAKIDHPHVVRAIDAGESGGIYYFIMEFVPGQSLREILKERGPLSEEEALGITEQMADALKHAEAQGIVHRDIKPDNIMVTPEGVAKLSDLGLAREVCDLSVTMAGTVIGTPYYMSPEQIQGWPDIDVRGDIYSLGATLFQALTNQYPFNATTPAAVIAKHLNDPRPDPAVKNPAVSKPMTRLVRKMMARERNNRPQGGAELLELISLTREASATETAGKRKPSSRRRRPPAEEGRRLPQKSGLPLPTLLGIGGAVLAIVVIAVLLLRGGGTPDTVPGRTVPETSPAVVTETAPERPRTERDTMPVVATETTPERSIPPDREQEASEALREAENERARDAGNLPAALKLMSSVARKYPKTPAGKKAAAEENAIRSTIDDRLAKVKSSANTLASKTRFKEAEQAYLSFLKTIPEDPWKARAEKEMEDIEKKAQEELRSRRKEIDALVAGRDFAKAHDMLMAVMDGTTVRLRKTMAKDVRMLEQKRREAEEKRAKTEGLLAEARQETLKHLENGKLDELIETYGRLRSDTRFADARPLLAKELGAFRKLQTIADNAEKGALSRIGQEFKVQGIVGTVAGAGGGNIRITSGGAEFVQPILKLKTSEILSLADLRADEARTPWAWQCCTCGRGRPTRRAGFWKNSDRREPMSLSRCLLSRRSRGGVPNRKRKS